jgi:carboxymethylenebutenolidase
VTELQKYLAEEVAEDVADGILTRREAMQRLGVLGFTASAAAAMLAAKAEAAPTAPRRGPRHGGRRGSTDDWAPVDTVPITFPGPRGELMAAWAEAEDPRGAVLVIHENRGLTDHIRTVASRLAGSGYSSLALDLLSEEGGTASFPNEDALMEALNKAAEAPERFDADMQAAVTELERRLPDAGLGAIGFCFGGGMIWRLLTSGERRLDAAAPFYGPFPTGGSFGDSHAAVLGVYGGLDERVNATRDAAQAALDAARLKYKLLTFTNANHAFFNDTGARFDLPAAAEAYHRVLDWFDRFVADRHRGHGHGHHRDDDDEDD